MDKAKENEGGREKGEANKSSASSAVIHDDIVKLLDFIEEFKHEEDQNDLENIDNIEKVSSAYFYDDIVELLDVLERLKNEEDQSDLDIDIVESLRLNLTILLRFVKFSYPDFDAFKATMSRNLDYIKSCFSSQHLCKSSATMTEDRLVELLDSILMKLHDLSTVESILPLMSQYEAIQSICGNIKDFHGLKVNGCIEPEIVEYVIPQFQLMANRVGYFCWALLADHINRFVNFDEKLGLSRVDVTLAHLLVKIIPVELEIMHICFTNLKASKSTEVGRFIKQFLEASPNILRKYLIHLEHHMISVTTACTSTRKIHVMIEFLLIILTDMPKDLIHHDKLFDLLARVGAVTKEVFILVRNLEGKPLDEESTIETNHTTLYLQENIELLMEDLKHVYLKAPDPFELCFAMSDGSLFMNLLLRNLNDFLNSNAYSIALIKEEIVLVKKDLEFIISFFGSVEQELNQDLWRRALDVGYEAKYVISSILARDNGLLHLIFSLPSAIQKIKLMKKELLNLREKIPKSRDLIVVNSPNRPIEKKSSTDGQIIVGFKEETESIIRKLTSGPAELDVISIIGMPGAGKTTLAYKVYNHRSIIHHFDIRAWCTVDQKYDRRIMLQKIFNQVTGSDEEFREDTDVDDVLRKKLYGRRYLIVLDDLWDTATWDNLTRPFPLVEKGSRIILTSRKREVALQGKRHSDPLDLRLLRPEESWELLEKRIFQQESCPVELLDVGKQIAQNCRGLPLVVDLIAGVIARREKEKSLWLELLTDLNSFIFNSEEEVMKVIQLSYDQLTDHLKLCFLYLGSYRKDEQIVVNMLKDFWSAEGFVEKIETKSMEEVMEDYLDHLVSSSLVTVSRGIYGKKFCKIHDLVHDFCLIKARKEKLFNLISSGAPSSSSSESMPRQLSVHYDKHVHEKFVLFDSENKNDSSGKHLLSLKITGNWKDHLIRHLGHLRLLRVLNLDFHFTVPDFLLNEMGMLVHLRYLNIGMMNIDALPSSFSNLWNLETLVVDSNGCLMALDPVIWNLAKLRHVDIRSCFFSDLGSNGPMLLGEDSKLENLRILERLPLSCSKGQKDILKRFPKLQKLDCWIGTSVDSSATLNWFPRFSLLDELEVLRVLNPHSFDPGDFPLFPSSLRSLTLEHGFMTSDSLSTIARIANLEELHLKHLDIHGKEWNMQDDDTFKNLKFLELHEVFFSEWKVGDESFPVLEQLILHYCVMLKEIPSIFGDIGSLTSIELINNLHLKDAALEIKQYVEDIRGDDKLQVVIR